MQHWQTFFSQAAQVILVLNIIGCISIRREQKQRHWTYFLVFLVLSLITEIVAKITWKQGINNLPLLHIYTLLEFLLLSLFFGELLAKTAKNRTYLLYYMAGVSALIVLNTALLQDLFTFNSNAKTLTQCSFILFSVVWLFQTSAEPIHENTAQNTSLFYIIAAILLYYAGSLFIFMASNALARLEKLASLPWLINAALYFVFQLLVATGLWRFLRTKYIRP